jgi:predicted lipoprotein with Yx(FWY)xxD motif
MPGERACIRWAIFPVHQIPEHEETNDMEQDMQHRKTTPGASVGRATAAVLAVAGLFASVSTVSPAGAAASPTVKSVVISALKTKKFGTVLVSGKTLYTLKPSKTPCNAACQKIWPEVLLPTGVTKATAGPGVSAAKLGTVKGAGGALQVTYSGKALYWFIGDKAPGQVNGNVTDTWGTWSDVATVKPASNPGTGGVAF